MWNAAQATVYYTAPVAVTAVGVYLLYRATEVEGSSADRAFGIGIVLVLSAWGWTATRSAKRRSSEDRRLENENCVLRRRVSALETEYATIRDEIHSRIASEVWLASMDRMDAHRKTTWVHFARQPD